METLLSIFYILAGFILRLAIPIGGTIILILFLRKLDSRWQAEAEKQALSTEKLDCWKVAGGLPEQVENRESGKSPIPCWQVYRLPNGYLNEKCMTCEVFTEAPVPALNVEPRRL